MNDQMLANNGDNDNGKRHILEEKMNRNDLRRFLFAFGTFSN